MLGTSSAYFHGLQSRCLFISYNGHTIKKHHQHHHGPWALYPMFHLLVNQFSQFCLSCAQWNKASIQFISCLNTRLLQNLTMLYMHGLIFSSHSSTLNCFYQMTILHKLNLFEQKCSSYHLLHTYSSHSQLFIHLYSLSSAAIS